MHDTLHPTEISFSEKSPALTHYLFRYPAKFHPPVARYLVQQFSQPDDVIADPFCGSGTLLLEGALQGRRMLGVDVDPVAAFVSRVKTTLLEDQDYSDLQRLARHLSTTDVKNNGSAPDIPNIEHWFEPHVLRVMTWLRSEIDNSGITDKARDLAVCAFLGKVRSWSNADPVPVSGLEVTRHIRERRKDGHFPDVVNEFVLSLSKAQAAFRQLKDATASAWRVPEVYRADSYTFAEECTGGFDSIITSPPYLSAVDYYRRHTLEMYWLDTDLKREGRARLKSAYIGQYSPTLSMESAVADTQLSSDTLSYVEAVRERNPRRARAAKHYFQSMAGIIRAWSAKLHLGGRLVLVLGDGKSANVDVPTARLLAGEAGEGVAMEAWLKYPLRNRYMTYSRHNGADISFESIIVMRKIA